jgi:hypothetical protein
MLSIGPSKLVGDVNASRSAAAMRCASAPARISIVFHQFEQRCAVVQVDTRTRPSPGAGGELPAIRFRDFPCLGDEIRIEPYCCSSAHQITPEDKKAATIDLHRV